MNPVEACLLAVRDSPVSRVAPLDNRRLFDRVQGPDAAALP